MQTRHNGTLTFKKGRRKLDGLLVEADAVLYNDAEIYTYTTLSEGIIDGTGTLWAHVSSKPIGGVIAPLETIIYYGETVITRRYLQIMDVGYVIASPNGDGNIVS